jgi:hypothetical protein
MSSDHAGARTEGPTCSQCRRRYLELSRNLAIDGHHQVVSDMFPEQPSAHVLHGTEDRAIKLLELVSGSAGIKIRSMHRSSAYPLIEPIL